MPTISVRKRLLRGSFQYLQQLRTRRRHSEQPDDTDSASASSNTSISSISSASSPSDISIESQSSEASHSGVETEISVDEDDLYLERLRAIQAHIQFLKTSRILTPNKVHKLSQLYLVLEAFKNDDPKRFRRNLRVSPDTFDILVTHIQDHHVFVSRGPNSQLPVREQFAIALFRFGHFGNSASVESIAQWAGVAAGTVVNSTRRVIVAFLALHDKVVRWPNEREKEEAKEWVEAVSCSAWRDGFCFVDGTLVPLADKPGYHGEAYFDRKSNYSFNVQLINLPNLRIIDYVLGHCGSAHDSTAFQDSRVYLEHQHLFRREEWIWADSAYPVQRWCVSPYKRPAADRPQNKKFNFWVSHVRIRSEHAVGYLKGRFSSLKGLRQQIDDELDHRRAIEWIRACIVIHTLISRVEEERPDLDVDYEFEEEMVEEGMSSDSESESEESRAVRAGLGRVTAGQNKRKRVQRDLFASGIVS